MKKGLLLFSCLLALIFSQANATVHYTGSSGSSSGGGGNPNVSNATGTLAVANGGTGCTTANCYYGLAHWRAALQNVKNGTGFAKVCFVADSIGYGVGSNGSVSSSNNNYPLNSFPTQISNYLTSDYGIKSDWQSFFGDGAINGFNTSNNNDPRVVVGSSWTQDTVIQSLGYSTFKASTTTNSLDFTPVGSQDTFQVFYVIDTSQGVLSWQLDTGTVTTVNTAGTQNVGVINITGSIAAHTLHVKYSSGGQVNVIGEIAYNSTNPEVIIVNAGSSSANSANMSGTAATYNAGNSAIYTAIGCDLTIIKDGTNDMNSAVSIPTYTANIQKIITAASASGGSVLLASFPPGNPGVSGLPTNAVQATYDNALIALSNTNLIPLDDNFLRWQSYAVASPRQMYADTYTHPAYKGYYEIAQFETKMIAGSPTQGNDPFNFNSHLSMDGNGTTSLIANTDAVPFTLLSSTTTAYDDIKFQTTSGSGYQWTVGVGGPSETAIGIPNKFFIFDSTNFGVRMAIDTTGNVGFGTVSPATKLDVNGDITMETGTAGAILCLTASHALGHCASGAACTGTCTCICTAN